MKRLAPLLAIPLAAGVVSGAEFGDKRDKPGEVQQLIVPREAIPPSTPRSPQEEWKSFQIAPGLRAELVASEPLVEDPVVTQIAPDGRLWVVEMRGFMAHLDGQGEELPVGRVVVLEDTDGDGVMDKSTVFVDGLVMPRALLLVGDGALVGAPPKLWYCRDSKGTGHADEKIEISSDFGWVNNPLHPELGNPEQAANSLLWGFDNWIQVAHYTRKFRFAGGQFSAGVTTFKGQWGLTQDNDGHLFYNSNQDPLRADILPSQYTGRNPNLDPCGGVNVQLYQDQLVWPIRVNPGVNRGYRREVLRENGRLKEFTAACSPHIYRGGMYPAEFEGNAFICEPAGNLIKREILTAANGTLRAKEAYDQRDFMASTDERFRPVNLTTGPDGALYVTDLYRGVLQHRESFTTYLRTYSEERGLDKPLHLGRIWRIVPDGTKPGGKPALNKETPVQWVTHLASANNWWRETAQRLLVERNDATVVPALRELAASSRNEMGRVHALWTLDGMHQVDEATVTQALQDSSPRVRAGAIRLCEGFLQSEARARVLPKLIAMVHESAPFTQQQLALTLGEAADPDADAALAALVQHSPENVFLRDAALSGLGGRELRLLERLAGQDSPDHKFVGALAQCVCFSRKAPDVERLLTLASSSPIAPAILDGILATAPVTARKPIKFQSEPAALKQIRDSRIARVSTLMTWPGKPGAKPEPPMVPLTAEEQTRYEAGKALFNGVCAACHQPHGRGLEGVAPPLVDSEWVLGTDQRLVRIVLHGLTGPVSVKGRNYRLDMPAFGAFSDDQISGILTFVRREWENNAAPVEPGTVNAIRTATADRHEAWVVEQLREIH
jgi:mono/diheme cytochrome c family protein/glucose/arabinose dehydrogenase